MNTDNIHSKTKKVLIYAPLAALGHHLETDLELIQTHLNLGHEVHVLRCTSQLKELKFMSCTGLGRCNLCKSRFTQGLELLTNKQKLNLITLNPVSNKAIPININLEDQQELKNFEYKGIDIGSAYLSDLISDIREAQPNLKNYKKHTEASLNKLAALSDNFEQVLNKLQPDLVLFFNGRFSMYRPLLRLCLQKNIEFYVHERGSSLQTYSLTHNHMPHHIPTKNTEMDQLWNDELRTKDEKINIAQNWYEIKAKGQMPAWRSFTDNQDDTLLPETWDKNQRNIAIFVSSEDEFSSVPGWEMPVFDSQVDAISYLCEKFSDKIDYQFYIRIHPNMKNLKNKSTLELLELGQKYTNCHIIAADSPVSTYNLMFSAEKVISFGSTVGVESNYWKVPSILLGKSFYMDLNVAYYPKTKEETLALVQSNLEPKPTEGALKFGYWISSLGIDFKFYKPESLTTGYFNGKMITGNKALMFSNYASILINDLIKIFKGEYSFWHLAGKVSNKMNIFSKRKKA